MMTLDEAIEAVNAINRAAARPLVYAATCDVCKQRFAMPTKTRKRQPQAPLVAGGGTTRGLYQITCTRRECHDEARRLRQRGLHKGGK